MRQVIFESSSKKPNPNIRNITYSAIFLAVTLVFKMFFSFYIPLFGEHGMKIGISGIFIIMPSILFGPVYGAIVSALSDFLGYFLNPVGAYLPLMTLVMALGGFLNGFIWQLLKNKDRKGLRIAVLIAIAITFMFGIWNLIFLEIDGINSSFYETAMMSEDDISRLHFISRLLIARTISTSNPSGNLSTYINFTTFGPIGFSVFGLVLVIADMVLSKKITTSAKNFSILRILITMSVSCVLVSTINTMILRNMLYESWKLLPFSSVWLPRVIEALVTNSVNAYLVAILYSILIKNFFKGTDD